MAWSGAGTASDRPLTRATPLGAVYAHAQKRAADKKVSLRMRDGAGATQPENIW